MSQARNTNSSLLLWCLPSCSFCSWCYGHLCQQPYINHLSPEAGCSRLWPHLPDLWLPDFWLRCPLAVEGRPWKLPGADILCFRARMQDEQSPSGPVTACSSSSLRLIVLLPFRKENASIHVGQYFKKQKTSFRLALWRGIFSMPGNVFVPTLWEFGFEGEIDMETSNYFPSEWTDHSGAVQAVCCGACTKGKARSLSGIGAV